MKYARTSCAVPGTKRSSCGMRRFLAAAQLLEHGHGAAGGLGHVEVAQARELDHFGG